MCIVYTFAVILLKKCPMVVYNELAIQSILSTLISLQIQLWHQHPITYSVNNINYIKYTLMLFILFIYLTYFIVFNPSLIILQSNPMQVTDGLNRVKLGSA